MCSSRVSPPVVTGNLICVCINSMPDACLVCKLLDIGGILHRLWVCCTISSTCVMLSHVAAPFLLCVCAGVLQLQQH
jgi:hypothetical protein